MSWPQPDSPPEWWQPDDDDDQISLTSNLNVLPKFLMASSWYSFGIITIIFSPIVLILPVNFIITSHLGIHLHINYIKYTLAFNGILYILGIRMYTMKQNQVIKNRRDQFVKNISRILEAAN